MPAVILSLPFRRASPWLLLEIRQDSASPDQSLVTCAITTQAVEPARYRSMPFRVEGLRRWPMLFLIPLWGTEYFRNRSSTVVLLLGISLMSTLMPARHRKSHG